MLIQGPGIVSWSKKFQKKQSMNKLKQFYGVEDYKSIKSILKVNLTIYVPVLVVDAFHEDLPFYGRNTNYSNWYYLICYMATLILAISFFIAAFITLMAIYRHLKSQ